MARRATQIHEAALGARIDIPTADGLARLCVPPGTQSGQSIPLHQRGVTHLRGNGRGDLRQQRLLRGGERGDEHVGPVDDAGRNLFFRCLQRV